MPNLPALTPTNFAEAMQFAELLAKSTMVPIGYQKNPANIVLAVQWGAELGLPALQALNSIAVINGKPALYGDTALALVLASVLCEDVIERFEGDGDSRTAICEARRKGRAPVTKKFSVGDAKRAGLWNKAGPWTQYPDRMLQMRARGFALRDAFPDVLRGVLTAEEAADIPRELKDITPPPASTVAAELDAFAGMAPDQAEVDPLLTEAHSFAQQGDMAFRQWYQNLNDDQRSTLSPHLRALGATARAADDARAAANQGEIDMGLAEPVGSAPVTDAPHDAASEDAASASSGGDPDTLIPVVLPARGSTGRVDWMRYANDVIAAARIVDPMHMHEFRVRIATPLNQLRLSNKAEWERVTKALAAFERGEDTDDERNLKDE